MTRTYYFQKVKITNTGKTRFKKGMIPANKGKKQPKPKCITCNIELKRYSHAKTCKKHIIHNWGNKISISLKKGNRKGILSSNWKGGISLLTKTIRACTEYKEWHKKIRHRDNHTCKNCLTRGGKLHVDHINPFAAIIHKNNIKTLEEALQCNELWDINNGRVLCEKCHHNRKKETLTIINKNK